MTNKCETCKHWAGDSSTFMAACGLENSGAARTTFDSGCEGRQGKRRLITADEILSDGSKFNKLIIGRISPIAGVTNCPKCGSSNITRTLPNMRNACIACGIGW